MRITKLEETSSVVMLKVEGALTPASVLAVENECRQIVNDGKWVRLDMVNTHFVDRAKAALLKVLSVDGVQIVESFLPLRQSLVGDVGAGEPSAE